jgi:hypothetical protein
VDFEAPSRVSIIGESAFSACHKLESVCIPASVEVISRQAFFTCIALSTVAFERDSRCSILGESAFHSCSSLASILLPSSVAIISKWCFAECPTLSNVEFDPGSRLVTIEEWAFLDCSSLSSLCLPMNVSRVAGLRTGYFPVSITIDARNENLRIMDSFLVDRDGLRVFACFGACQQIRFPKSIERIEEWCCDGCLHLSSVDFEPGSRMSVLGTRVKRHFITVARCDQFVFLHQSNSLMNPVSSIAPISRV